MIFLEPQLSLYTFKIRLHPTRKISAGIISFGMNSLKTPNDDISKMHFLHSYVFSLEKKSLKYVFYIYNKYFYKYIKCAFKKKYSLIQTKNLIIK